MPQCCASCERSLATMQTYRRRGETYRPGSIAPSTRSHLRGRSTLCSECFRELPPRVKQEYALQDAGDRFGRWG